MTIDSNDIAAHVCNSKNDTASDGSITQTLNGSLVGHISAVVEIVAAT